MHDRGGHDGPFDMTGPLKCIYLIIKNKLFIFVVGCLLLNTHILVMATLTKEQIEQKKKLLEEKEKEIKPLSDEALEQAAGGTGYHIFSGVNPSDPTQVV